jgi:hypothetical protein
VGISEGNGKGLRVEQLLTSMSGSKSKRKRMNPTISFKGTLPRGLRKELLLRCGQKGKVVSKTCSFLREPQREWRKEQFLEENRQSL